MCLPVWPKICSVRYTSHLHSFRIIVHMWHAATDRSSSWSIICLSLTPCDVFHRGLLTSAAYAPINHAVLTLNSTLFRHLHASPYNWSDISYSMMTLHWYTTQICLTTIVNRSGAILWYARQNAKKHKGISSLNKRSTGNVLNFSPSYFVTATVLPDVFSTAKSGMFRRSSWVALAQCALHSALSCINTKSPDLNRWESNKTKMDLDWSANNIEGYMYFAMEKASSSSRRAGSWPIQHIFS